MFSSRFPVTCPPSPLLPQFLAAVYLDVSYKRHHTYVPFCDCLLPFSIMFSRFILVACVNASLLFFKLLNFIFLGKLSVHSKIEQKSTDIPYTLCHVTNLSLISIPSGARVVHLLQSMTLHRHTITARSPKGTSGLTAGVLQSIDLDKHAMTCIPVYSLIQSTLTVLKIPCAPPVPPSSPQPLTTTDLVTFSIALSFP